MNTTRQKVRCKSTGYGSPRFGLCEECKQPCADTWIGTSDNGVSHVFGHEGCVRSRIGLPAAKEI